MEFADIDLKLSTGVWDCNIYTVKNNEVIVIDCMTKASGLLNRFYIRDLDVLESLLRCYFGFKSNDVNYVIEQCIL